MGGISLVKKVKKNYPDVKILMLSMYEEKYIISKALKAGADGYISKNASKKIIIDAIESCMKGEKVVSLSKDKINQLSLKSNEKKLKQIILTKREKQILKLITEEVSHKDISLALDISKRTVEAHKQNMILKHDAKNTVGLIKIALKKNLFQPQKNHDKMAALFITN